MRFKLSPFSPNGITEAPASQPQPYFQGGPGKVSLLDSVNGKHGAVQITGGTNVTVDNSGTDIVINSGDVEASAWGTITGDITDQTDVTSYIQSFRLDQLAAPTADLNANNQKIYNLLDPTSDQDAATKAYVDANAGGSGTGVATVFSVAQTAHGFVVGDILRNSGTANTYAKAQADTAAHAEVVGIVTTVTNANNFSLTTHGIITAGVPAEAAGAVLFLSDTVAGALTTTEPTDINTVSKPLAIVLESSVKMVLENFRGELITTTSGGGAGTITVSEEDGVPSVADVTELIVTNGTLTDNGDGTVSLDTGGGGGTPGGSDTYVQFNDGSAFGGDAGFTYDKTTDTLSTGILSLATDLSVANGGTGASTVATARNNLGTQARIFYTVGGADADYVTGGTADDVQIQAAIDAAALAGGGTVYVKEGTYYLAAKISMASNVTLRGDGDATILKQTDTTNINNTIIEASAVTSARVMHLKVDGNKDNNITYGRGITIKNSTTCLVEHVTVIETRDHAINIRESSYYNTVRHVYCEDILGAGVVISNGASYNNISDVKTKTATNSGIYITGSDYNRVISCYSEATYYGFDVYDSYSCSFEDCMAIDPTYDQFHIEDAQDVTYNNCIGDGGRDGLAVYSTVLSAKLATNIFINNLQTKNATHYGINLVGTASLNIETVSIMGGNISDCTAYGIYATYTTGLEIGGGIIIDNNGGVTYDGIRLDTNVISGSITTAQVINNGAYAIRVHSASVDKFQIHSNTYIGNGTDEVLNNSTGTVSTLNPKLDIIFDSTGTRKVIVSRGAAAGADFTVQAGGGVSGGTNTNGGALVLASGIATGSARSPIEFWVPTPGSSGTTDNNPAWAATVWQASANGPVISLQANSSTTGLPLASNAFAVRGNVAGGITAYRHTTINTAGNTFTIQASGASSGATDKAGGSLILKSGISTGTGNSQILLQTADVGSTGTTDNGFTTRATLSSTGLALAVPLTLTTQLAVAQGGTGATTLTGVLKGNGTSAITGSATLTDLDVPTADFSMASHKLTNVTDPSANQDAATKAYVDSVAQGLDAKASCRVATTVAGTLASSFENGDTIDGVALATGDRILIKNQVTGSENGIYTVNASGAPTRATDADTDPEVTSGMFTFITAGTSQANTGWVLTTSGAITLGSTSLAFSQFSATTSVVGGAGLTLTGSTLDVVGTSNRISVAADSIDISSSYVGQTSITTLGTIATGTWSATTVAVNKGGTGATTLTGILKGNGTSAITDAATLDDVGAPTVDFSMNTLKITNLATPSASTDAATKGYADSLLTGGGTYTAQAFVVDGLTGSTTTALGLDTSGMGDSTLSANTLKHIYIGNVQASSLTTQLGIDIGALTAGGTTNVGLRIATPSGATVNRAIDLTGTGGTAASGITFGDDVTLYRSAANVLKTDDSIVINGSLTLGTDLAITEGGTGASTATTAFDNLAPTTTQGDIIYHNGTDNVRLAKGTASQHLRMNSGATAPEWATVANRNLVELSGDISSTASTSYQNITGLSFSVTSGVNYRFYAIIPYTTSAATIGIRVSLTSPSTTLLAYTTRTGLSSTGSTDATWENHQTATDSGTVSTSSVTTSGGNVIILEGFIRPSASGTVQLRFAPETATASGVVIKTGATLEWW